MTGKLQIITYKESPSKAISKERAQMINNEKIVSASVNLYLYDDQKKIKNCKESQVWAKDDVL